jgi:hypothetical protein
MAGILIGGKDRGEPGVQIQHRGQTFGVLPTGSCQGGIDAGVLGKPSPPCGRNRDGWRRDGQMTIAQRSLYQVLRHKVDRPQTPVTGRFRLPAGWREQLITYRRRIREAGAPSTERDARADEFRRIALAAGQKVLRAGTLVRCACPRQRVV